MRYRAWRENKCKRILASICLTAFAKEALPGSANTEGDVLIRLAESDDSLLTDQIEIDA